MQRAIQLSLVDHTQSQAQDRSPKLKKLSPNQGEKPALMNNNDVQKFIQDPLEPKNNNLFEPALITSFTYYDSIKIDGPKQKLIEYYNS